MKLFHIYLFILLLLLLFFSCRSFAADFSGYSENQKGEDSESIREGLPLQSPLERKGYCVFNYERLREGGGVRTQNPGAENHSFHVKLEPGNWTLSTLAILILSEENNKQEPVQTDCRLMTQSKYQLKGYHDFNLVMYAHNGILQRQSVVNASLKMFSLHYSTQLRNKWCNLGYQGTSATMNGDADIPTLTPLPHTDANKQRNKGIAATVGGILAVLIVVVILVLVYICLVRVRRFIRQTSQSASSVPSPTFEQEIGNTSAAYGGRFPAFDTRDVRRLSVEELEQATRSLDQSNLIGQGRFGLTFKGLLQDGTIVAIKRRLHNLIPNFVNEGKKIACIHHLHLVKLIGFFEDSHQQFIVNEFMSNGNIGNHLYDIEGLPTGKLGIRQRLSIATGAAKGLEHLHSLDPPMVHTHFRTSNVLVDENFTSKVSDYGICKLLSAGDSGMTSSDADCFLDPESSSSRGFPVESDVYSFGVFLLELISGRTACDRNGSNSQENLVFQAKHGNRLNGIVDRTLGEQAIKAAKLMMQLAWSCLEENISSRPSMKLIVQELERIQETEVGPLHPDLELEENVTVTLGSELFK